MALLSSAIQRGLAADRPASAPGKAGQLYFSTDTKVLEQDDGSSWAQIAANLAIGVDVQAYDADLTAWAGKTAPGGAVVGTSDSQTLTNKTLTAPAITTPTGIVKGDVGLGNVDNTSNATERAAAATLTNKTLTAPTIADFTNAGHDHGDADDGGTLDAAAIASGVLAIGRLATGTPDGTKFVRDDGTLAVPAGTGFANPMTTAGDLIVGGASGTPARLAKGSDGQVLTVDPTTHLLVWATPGSGGVGDVVGPASSVDAEVALFDSTTGKLLKRASATGIAKLTSGVLSAVTAPSGTIVGTSDNQTLTNKTITVADANLTIQDDGDATKQAKFQASGITAGQTRTLAIPDASTTLVGTDATQTLTNKSIDAGQLTGTVAQARLGTGSGGAGTKVLYDDQTYKTPAAGGDASTNTATSVDSEIALFSSTTGKVLKRATTTGLVKATSGVIAAAVAGTDYAPAAVGFMPFAFPLGTAGSESLASTANLAANGGTGLFPFLIVAPILVESLSIFLRDTSTARSYEWRVFQEPVGGGATLNEVAGLNGSESYTPIGAATRTTSATTPATIQPGLCWLAIRNTHATSTLGLGAATNSLTKNRYRTKTLGAGLTTTLDGSTGWAAQTNTTGLQLNGRVMAEGSAF